MKTTKKRKNPRTLIKMIIRNHTYFYFEISFFTKKGGFYVLADGSVEYYEHFPERTGPNILDERKCVITYNGYEQ